MIKNPSLILSEEHTVIMKVIEFLENSMDRLEDVLQKKIDLFDVVIDFFRVFADQGHHGKEENIFFKKLESKPLLDEEKKILCELIEEHKQGRALIAELDKVKRDDDFNQIKMILMNLIKLYKAHIQKENIRFFPPTFKYFSEEEIKQMLFQFYESDRTVFFKKYKQLVENLTR